MDLKTKLKWRYKGLLWRMISPTFGLWERLGFHVTLNHFYQPIPDVRNLPDALWTTLSELPGIDMNEEAQVALLKDFASEFRREYESLPAKESVESHGYYLDNVAFHRGDSEMLYGFIRSLTPSRIIEVGSGMTTRLICEAVQANRRENPDYLCDYLAIDPYPGDVVRNGIPGLSRLIETPVQEVPIDRFEGLGPNDILFVDSSHTLKIGSDVQYLFLEVVPRLAPGAVVHVHDVFFPMEYPKAWFFKNRWFFNEQYLVQAFLAFNSAFEILWASSYMHQRRPELMRGAFGAYDRDGKTPSSLWIRRRESLG